MNDKIEMSKFDYELYRRISEPYDNVFWSKKKALDNRFGIAVSLVSVSVDVKCEIEIEYNEYLKHDDGTFDLTFANDDTHAFIEISCLYMADREKALVKTIFDFRNSLEIGEMADKMYSDFEQKISDLYGANEKPAEKDGESPSAKGN